MYHSIFIHSSIEGHLSCFQVLATNKVDINFWVKVMCRHKFSTLVHKYQEAQLLDHIKRMFNFGETAKLSSKVAV